MRLPVLLLSFLLMFFAAGSAVAKDKPNKHQGNGHGGKATAHRFQAQEIDVIRGYYHGGGGSLPPGLAKKGGLPPGLAKKGGLPPGLAKKIAPFPVVLEQRLPPPPYGYRRVIVDRWALLINDATNVVFDILDLTRR